MTDTQEPPARTPERAPVEDWRTDFDHTHPDYGARAPEIWDELRSGGCPVAHTDRFGGAWLPVRHQDVAAIANDTEHFTSEGVIVSDERPLITRPIGPAPPITSDPPFHAFARRLLLPAFSAKAVAPWEEATRTICRELLDGLDVASGSLIDGAADYAQHIPVMVIADMLGVPRSDGDKFRAFIHRIIEDPQFHPGLEEEDTLDYYLDQVVADHRANPRGDLVDYLLGVEIEGEPLSPEHVRGTIALLLIAGIDTTWSAIGASLHHLATHPDDLRRLAEEPELMDTAVEEFLRFYAPVTMARIVAEDVEVGGCPMKADDWVLLPFPAANRDPEAFEDADTFVIDRARNRHAAFGLGIHRCLGSNLARMELKIAIEEWIARIPTFEAAGDGRWSAGQVRGPRELPLRVV